MLHEIATAYGIRKRGSLEIINILSEVRGYSRSYKVLFEKALLSLGSNSVFKRGLNELLNSGFIIKKTGQRGNIIKISPYVINRKIECLFTFIQYVLFK